MRKREREREREMVERICGTSNLLAISESDIIVRKSHALPMQANVRVRNRVRG